MWRIINKTFGYFISHGRFCCTLLDSLFLYDFFNVIEMYVGKKKKKKIIRESCSRGGLCRLRVGVRGQNLLVFCSPTIISAPKEVGASNF